MQCFSGSWGYLWWRQTEVGVHTHRAIITHIVAFWPIRLVESGCEGCPKFATTTNKSYVRGNTRIYMMCFEVKRDITPPYSVIYVLFFSLAAVESHFAFDLKRFWSYILVLISAGFLQYAQIPIRLSSLLRCSQILIGLDTIYSLQTTWILSDFPILHVNYNRLYSLLLSRKTLYICL